jgi:UDPglucose--hexose-1-phosphate uridylyltransferase
VTYISTSVTLADGRALTYFDHRPGRDPLPDKRKLPIRSGRGEMRYDELAGEWVIVADHRQDRIFLPQEDSCPLCPSSSSNQTEVPDPKYEVVVVDNRFPSLSTPSGRTSALKAGSMAKGTNLGHCEVVCFTDNHQTTFADLSVQRVALVIAAWQNRTADLLARDWVEYVFVFENFGEDIGVTISHPHGQIYAYPFIPPRALTSLRAIKAHHDAKGQDLIAELIARERASRERIVDETEYWIAFVPFAARWPFQVHLHSKDRVADFTELSDAHTAELAWLYPRLLKRFHNLFEAQVPYIAAWNQAPRGSLNPYGRLYLDVFTTRRDVNRLKFLAGSESAMGAFVNDISPEKAARMLAD